MGRPRKVEAGEGDIFDLLISGLEKEHGKGVIFNMSTAARIEIPRVSYGSFAVDIASGGGAPKGRIVEIYGPESSGKTTLALNLIKEAQQDLDYLAEKRVPLFIDAEHALDLNYAQNGIGVDPSKLLICQPETGEQALQVLEAAIKTGKISVAVVDSVSTLVPKAELEGDIGASHVGLQARLMSQALRMLTPLCARTGTTLIFLNQIRMKIGVMFGSPETTSGGNALKFYASQRIDIRRLGSIKGSNGEAFANKVRVNFVKNKTAPPYRSAEIDLRFGIGIDLVAETLDLAEKSDLILKSGAWYSWPNGDRIAQGRENSIAALRESPELFNQLRAKVRENLFNTLSPEFTEDAELNDDDSSVGFDD